MSRRYDILQQVLQLDPQADCQEITYLVGAYEYPWLIKKSLEFALFRTYGVPSVARVLDSTSQFYRHGQRRYDDTTLILSEIVENGYDSERGLRAIKVMNHMHNKYNIPNEDMLYVLSTFIYEPIRWSMRFGWRKPTHHENLASYYFWCEVGKRMGIKDLPETYEQFEQFNRNYEQKYYRFDPANRRVADGTIEIMMSWYPSFLHPLVREAIYALIDEPLRQAFGYRKANPITRWVVPMGLQVLAQIVKRMPPRKTPYLLTRIPTPSHPNGYEIEQLGPPSDHSKGTQGTSSSHEHITAQHRQ